MTKKIFQQLITTPFGVMEVTAHLEALLGLRFLSQEEVGKLKLEQGFLLQKKEQSPIVTFLQEEIEAYRQGNLPNFKTPLEFQGTPFQETVWEALLQIPYGTTISYQEIARKIGREKSVRAVGNAVGANRIALLIPCHRVLPQRRRSGEVGGYRWGAFYKERLLTLEKAL